MVSDCDQTEELLRRAAAGECEALRVLLDRHRARLRRMVAVRLDRRLAARVDPSDVVQEALADAYQHLDDYLRHRPLPFYPWLRQIAWERLVDLHRRHIDARRRSVAREEAPEMELPDESADALVDRLVASGTSPSRRLIREELRGRVQAALAALAARDREVLVMRYLEQLTAGEIADVLGIVEGAVRMRLVRALERLRGHLDDPHARSLNE
jgi:RNA polymerase sigma-70 factor (ECF subfamily)